MWLSEHVMAAGKSIGTFPYDKDGINDETEMDFVVTLYSGSAATALCWWMRNHFSITTDRLVELVLKWVYDASPSKEMSK